MVKCPRCGLRYNHVNIHLVSLPRVSPRRRNAAAMFANEYMTTGDLNERLTGKRGKLSPFHRERLSEGLKRMGVADSAACYRNAIAARRTATAWPMAAAPIAVFAWTWRRKAAGARAAGV